MTFIGAPLVHTDDEYSDVMHAIALSIEEDRKRVAELRGGGLGRYAVPFEQQIERFERLQANLETRYNELEED